MSFLRRGRPSGRRHDDRSGEAPASEAGATPDAGATPPPRSGGPYDLSDAPDQRRLDLGSLQIPSVTGVEIRMQANPEGMIQRVALVHGESALQVAAFAAPRSEGIWDEVWPEIRASLVAEGATVQEVDGEYGRELHARITTPEGPKDLRVVGVDGPRWMVRADFYGPVAVDPAAGAPLRECLQGLVVDRGTQARPVREVLPLRLSKELAAQVQRQRSAAAPPGTPAGPVDGAGPAGRPTAAAATSRRGSPQPRRRG